VPALIRRASVLIIGIVIGGGFYLLLIDTTSLPELYVLAGVALACGIAVTLAREQGFVEARIAALWLARGWRLVWKVPGDIAIVCWEAVAQLVRPRRVRGEFRAAPFKATAETPPATGRRAIAETLGSVAPNTIVVGVDADRGLILVHQLRRQGGPGYLDVTGMG
jgi:hypothetical protein